MSPPIRDGSGSSIGSIRLGDGSEIAEVRTGAGDALFRAIPDSEDLNIRTTITEVSGSDGDSISSVPDATGNNSDLTGDGVYRVGAFNSRNALEYSAGDSTTDGHQVGLASTVSPPYLVSFVANWTNILVGTGPNGLFGISSNDPNGSITDEDNNSGGNVVVFDGTGSGKRLTVTESNPSIWSLVAPDSSTFDIHLNGTKEIGFSGSGVAPTFDVLAQGKRYNASSTNAQIPEVLGYDYGSSSDISRSDIESYLDNEYGPIL